MIDLKKIRTKIENQRDAIAAKIKRLRREDPFSTEDRAIIMEPGTDAAQLFSHEQIAVLEEQLKHDLNEIESALTKMKKGTYGICERCKKSIDPKRLGAKPQAVYCLKCEREIEAKK
ncbi:TraR/DksA C4-type zinc finger protein [Candidatus Curtissbacteria bacterium]|nr:TraR/DksA C4-type zinc finger protein [Candidatus Curtissbacteria bacterium]